MRYGAGAAMGYRKEAVTSADGTTIGYRVYGAGPALLLIHGALQSSQSFDKLAALLSDAFTVCVPDRRGRGMSGPFGENYRLAKECDDIEALTRATGATSIFGLSSGAIITLAASQRLPELTRVAAYEPPFTTEHADPASWASRYERDLADGDLAAAMATIVTATGDRDFLSYLPRALLKPLFRMGIAADLKKAKGDEVPIAKLIPTVHFDCLIQREASAKLDELAKVRAQLLLLEGDRSAISLGRSLDDFAKLVPGAHRKMLHGVGHIAASDQGRPELVAAVLRPFFTRV